MASKGVNRVVPIHLRFWRFVEKSEGCWVWSGAKDKHGYGNISSGRGLSPYKAYRLAYEMFNGPIKDGLVIRHKCDNPSCVNPEHLEIGTQKDNVRDMMERGRFNPVVLNNLRRDTALNADQVREIESLKFVGVNGRGIGVTTQEVAIKYNVCPDTIRAVKNGKHPYSKGRAA